MAFDPVAYMRLVTAAGIGHDVGTGQYKGDYYICGGSSTPHIHVAKAGDFVGFKKKRGAMTTLVKDYMYKRSSIEESINDVKDSTTPNDQHVTNALRILGRMEKEARE